MCEYTYIYLLLKYPNLASPKEFNLSWNFSILQSRCVYYDDYDYFFLFLVASPRGHCLSQSHIRFSLEIQESSARWRNRRPQVNIIRKNVCSALYNCHFLFLFLACSAFFAIIRYPPIREKCCMMRERIQSPSS